MTIIAARWRALLALTGATPLSTQRLGACHHDVPEIDPTTAAIDAIVSRLMLGVHHSEPAHALPAWRRK